MADKRDQTPRPNTATESEVSINLSELFYRLLEKWLIIALCAILGCALSAVYTFQFMTPMYEATAKMYVLSQGNSAINLSDLQIGAYLTNDYREVFKTWVVHEGVISNLGLSYSYSQIQNMLTITNPSDTRVLYVTVASDDPEEAKMIANEYVTVAKKYIKGTMDTEEPRVMAEALTPTMPVTPNKTLNLLLGFVLGAFLAISVVVIRFALDDTLKTSDDILKYIDMPTLAVVPAFKANKNANEPASSKAR